MSKFWNASGLFLSVCLASGAAAREDAFISEASGVCRLGQTLVVAGDENPDSLWTIDDKSQTVKVLEVRNGKWDDLEDVSRMDDHRFFAVTSHSRTKKGKLKPEREQLLLISKKKSYFEIDRTWSLRNEILSVLESSVGQLIDIDTVKEASPDEGGLNVEGLAYHQGQLFLGLRSPLTNRGDALVLRIKNADGLLDGESPVFTEVMTVALGKKGIRGLASEASGLLVIAGSSNDTGKDFSLYQWATSGAPKAFALRDFATLIRPEGVLAERDGSFTFVQDFEEPSEQDVVVRLPGKKRKRPIYF